METAQIIEKIENAQKILIISHVNPDGDTLGSMCALKLSIGERADMLVQTRPGQEIPEIYEFLPLIKTSKTLRNVENIYDLVITVDIASTERMVLKGRDIFNSANTSDAKMTINIDHHITNPKYAKINLIDPKASSCGEILYDLFKAHNIEITKDIANCLYVAIMTDTGAFRYDNTTTKTLCTAADLLECGANAAELAARVYDSKSKAMVMFQAFCTSNIQFIENGKVAYIIVKNADMEKFDAKHEHTEGLCEIIRSINTVEVAAVIKENQPTKNGGEGTKVSLRTKEVDATKITEKFNGGGHKRSAGCTINKPIEAATKLLIEQVKKVLYD